MNCIHENEVNKITECNLIHDIRNPYKLIKILNSHQSPILHGCMNIRKCRAKFKNFHILLDSRCSSTIIMIRIITKLNTKLDTMMQWHTQEVNITTNLRVKLDLPYLNLAQQKP